MGILMVYDVTDEKSFDSESKRLCSLIKSLIGTRSLRSLLQTSERGTLTSNNMPLLESTRSSLETSATGMKSAPFPSNRVNSWPMNLD